MCINILCIPHKQRGRYLRLLAINSLQVGLAAVGRIYEPCTFQENDGPKTKLCALYVLSWKSAECALTSDYTRLLQKFHTGQFNSDIYLFSVFKALNNNVFNTRNK